MSIFDIPKITLTLA